MIRTRTLMSFVLAVLLFGVSGSFAGQAKESYYMLLFSQDTPEHQPSLSHTFAAFVKATGSGPDQSTYQIETHTISWLPASLDVRLLRLFPEQGINLSLKESLRHARSLNARVSMWGPYQIKKGLYDRAVQQEKRLNSGRIAYKAIDRRFRPDVASNCFHAVSDLDTENGLLDTGTAHGDDATAMVESHLERWIIHPEKAHTWVARRLGVNDSSIQRIASSK